MLETFRKGFEKGAGIREAVKGLMGVAPGKTIKETIGGRYQKTIDAVLGNTKNELGKDTIKRRLADAKKGWKKKK